jgi:transposase
MDGSKERPKVTAGVDLGDKYSYLCLIETQSAEVIEEGRLRTTPEAFRRRFASEQPPMRIAIEAGTHSPWASRVQEECGHEVLVANARKLRLIYANNRKTDEIDALRIWLVLALFASVLEWIEQLRVHSCQPTWP